MRVDKHTLANIDAVECTSMELDLSVDFECQQLSGFVEYTSKLLKDTSEFVLDTKALEIEKVTVDGIECTFNLSTEKEVFGSALFIILPSSKCTKDSKFITRIFYSTTPESSSIQFLSKEQTADGKYPYLFTQCQAIHARSLLPCQDCPLAKTVYKAFMTVPEWATCLMSAVESKPSEMKNDKKTFFWEQKVAVPSYLIAIVIGHIESREIGPRSRVWSEPSCVDSCAYEFAQTEDFLKNAEDIMGQEYVWGRYDIVSLPPSFPYGGMENPCLTFATPTLIAGDRSLADVIAHEIAHSWTGNLITNHTWEHFWLNEGWTMWLQRKIMGRIRSHLFFDFDASLGYNALQSSIDHFGPSHEFTKLVPNLTAVDPDDSFSSVPYEKGFFMLYFLSTIVGHDNFEIFAKAYTQEFKFKTVTSDQFKSFFLQFFSDYKDKADDLAKIDWDSWFYGTGMPSKPVLDNTLSLASSRLAERWVESGGDNNFSEDDIKDWSSSQLVAMLECIDQLCSKRGKYLTISALKQMGTLYSFSTTKNSEVRFNYQSLCIHSEADFILPATESFLKEQGRMKFVRPLYRDLNKSVFGNTAAKRIFALCKDNYHPIAKKMIARDLNV